MTDIETCYKAFRGEIIRELVITLSGFGFEVEVTVRSEKLKRAIYEVPISYYGRTYEEGKRSDRRTASQLFGISANSICLFLQENPFVTCPLR